ncbi:hypothetical protein B0A53_04097 [Rhodotorula sp. CCFEE 5036]|nr:hypothetical protein B0A53_04097 [Rhodotorula sp. CCFEE 5036]
MASFNVASLKPEIERILETADRSSISAKAVRKALQEKFPELDVKTHKAEIDALTTRIFTAGASGDEEEADVKPTVTSPKPKLPNFSKVKRARSPSSTVDSSDAVPASSPAFSLASTRVKKEKAPALTDEELARQMQAEFEQQATVGRSTRNGGSAASAAKKRAPIKKSKKNKKAGSDDDDDGAVKKKKRKTSHTGFNKLHVLSDEMAEVCGAPVLSRPGVTKALWKYIKANDLQDPDLRTDILPDDQLKKVLPFERINSFKMAKHLGAHLYPYDEAEHGHLAPPLDPVSDADSDPEEEDRKPKPKSERGTPSSSSGAVGVQRANGRTKSAAEVDSEDDLSF